MPRSARETIRDSLEKCIELHEAGKFDVAEIILRQTLRAYSEQHYTSKDEDSEKALQDGMKLLCEKNPRKALPCFEEAYRLKPDSRPAFINSVYCNFDLGKYEAVWELYEDRLRHFDQLIAYQKMFDPAKKWNGKESLVGKRVLVFCEQGLGDTINFCRYLKYLKQEGCKVVLNCASALKRLFETPNFQFIVDEVVTKESVSLNSVPEHDYHLPIMSLPLLLKMPKPNPQSYLDIYGNPKFKQSKFERVFHIGFIAKGNPASGNDKIRSISANWFNQLKLPRVRLHNLHHAEVVNGCENYVGRLNDLYDVAELIREMDLIVTVDTAVLHLAGSMGMPTWAVLPANPDWRWGLEGEKCVWYDSVRLFRQDYLNDWEGVFKKVKTELEDYVANHFI